MVRSENIEIHFRLKRSAAIPAAGLNKVTGRYAASPDIPSISGEAVRSASHQISAN